MKTVLLSLAITFAIVLYLAGPWFVYLPLDIGPNVWSVTGLAIWYIFWPVFIGVRNS